ncbi:alginate lyase-domain-containing protein [Favolaschia claudopus]|uniref:Alginate lyase-domain-containing protein n=1 Tax=Favolaschia claudopus TaxID=2862362 RepID=A0AAW0AED6_9AGAR
MSFFTSLSPLPPPAWRQLQSLSLLFIHDLPVPFIHPINPPTTGITNLDYRTTDAVITMPFTLMFSLQRRQDQFSILVLNFVLVVLGFAQFQLAAAANPFTCYANDFVAPDRAVAPYASKFTGAQDTIVAWADEMASYGPWSVTYKPVVAPSNDKHDYMSWAPYQWPDCSKVPNRNKLTQSQVWKTCPYVFRDGQVNPDRWLPNDFQSFFNLSDAVLYNAIASTFQNDSSSKYSQNAVKFINTYFLDSKTAINPNLNYAQMNRGPNGQHGEYTGILYA